MSRKAQAAGSDRIQNPRLDSRERSVAHGSVGDVDRSELNVPLHTDQSLSSSAATRPPPHNTMNSSENTILKIHPPKILDWSFPISVWRLTDRRVRQLIRVSSQKNWRTGPLAANRDAGCEQPFQASQPSPRLDSPGSIATIAQPAPCKRFPLRSCYDVADLGRFLGETIWRCLAADL